LASATLALEIINIVTQATNAIERRIAVTPFAFVVPRVACLSNPLGHPPGQRRNALRVPMFDIHSKRRDSRTLREAAFVSRK
jgi:hypothetical protein